LVWWCALVAVWLTAAGTVTIQELVLAGVTGVACAWAAVVLRGIYGGEWRLVSAWGLPVAIVRESGALFSGHANVRRVDVRPAVKAVRTLVLSASPGTVVLDDKDGSLLVHTLGRG
jgi:multisubunit Na+/H+ antiporter MnhE subunit